MLSFSSTTAPDYTKARIRTITHTPHTHIHLSPLLDPLSLPSHSPPSSHLTPKSPLSSPFTPLFSPPLLYPPLPHSILSPSSSLYLSLSPSLFPLSSPFSSPLPLSSPPPLTCTGSLVFSSFTVRSSSPDPSASFFPSAPPTSYRFCTSVATLVSTSGEEWGLWATPSSLEVNLGRHT